MESRLSKGCFEAILSGRENFTKPVVQLLTFKCMSNPGAPDRYRLLLSDGIHSFSYAMLSTDVNHLITNNIISNLALISLDKYVCNVVGTGKKVIVVLECSVVAPAESVNVRLGDPTPYTHDSNTSTEATKSNEPVNQPLTNSNRPNVHGMQPTAPFDKKGSSTPLTNRVNTIDSLTPYQNRWRVRARVTGKSGIRTWSNSRGEGKLFNFNLLDDTGEIKVTAFNQEVDKFFDMIEVNKVYFISKGTLKSANKQYSNLKNDYEMTLNADSLIEPSGDDNSLPQLSFDFVKINELDKQSPQNTVDVIGVVKTTGDVTTIIGRQSQKEVPKRELTLVDQSGMSVAITLWGNEAIAFSGKNFPVLAVKGAKVSDFNGRSLSVLASCDVLINPDIRESHLLRGWYDRDGCTQEFGSYHSDGVASGGFTTNWKTFAEVKSEGLGGGDKPDYFTTKATITFVKKENCMYMACASESCNKKVVDLGNGMYRCEKCQQEFPNFKWRMLLNVNLSDYSDNQWATCFQDSAEAILNVTANELGDLREKDEGAFDHVFSQATFKSFIFKLRIKMETFNDESRMKAVVMSAAPMDYITYGKKLIDDIQLLLR